MEELAVIMLAKAVRNLRYLMEEAGCAYSPERFYEVARQKFSTTNDKETAQAWIDYYMQPLWDAVWLADAATYPVEEIFQ